MIRKLRSGEYRLYSRKVDPRTGKRRNLGTFPTREAAEKPFQFLVVDEYHWLADPQRGNHYEGVLLSTAPDLQLLLLSGAVGAARAAAAGGEDLKPFPAQPEG
jgi:hypothetical protein